MDNIADRADGGAVEYGARWKRGEASPEVERVIRRDGVISAWDIAFEPNVGGKVKPDAFGDIDLFSPGLVRDALGNVFRRFGRFYVGEQTDGEYEYIWVCKTPADSSYRLPRAFFHKGEPHWNFVDIGAYEGGTDTVGGALVLTSKSGYTPAVNISRRDAFGAAKACGDKCGADGEREFYCITALSEITEILQPLLFIMLGTRNAHSVYGGVNKVNTVGFKPAMSVKDTNRVLFSFDKYKEKKLAKQFPVGCCVWYESVANDESELSRSGWRRVIESGSVEVDGTAYYAITLDGPSFKVNKSTSRVWRGIAPTGLTDGIAATHGTQANDGTCSFKLLGIENIYGNYWKHVLDCTTADRVPYICSDLTAWNETNNPDESEIFEKCGIKLCGCGRVKEARHDGAHADVKLPVEAVDVAEVNAYYCDMIWTSALTSTALFGGTYDDWTVYDKDAKPGLSCWAFYNGVGTKFINIGARLSRRAI